jgi:hypothetical protein
MKVHYQKPFLIRTVTNDNFGTPQIKAIRVDTQTPSFWTVCISEYSISSTLAFSKDRISQRDRDFNSQIRVTGVAPYSGVS